MWLAEIERRCTASQEKAAADNRLEVVELASWDGGSANNPCPDDWERETVIRCGNAVFRTYGRDDWSDKVVETAADVAEIHWLDDDDLGRVMAAIEA